MTAGAGGGDYQPRGGFRTDCTVHDERGSSLFDGSKKRVLPGVAEGGDAGRDSASGKRPRQLVRAAIERHRQPMPAHSHIAETCPRHHRRHVAFG
jgi:hypothetical protein